jgi:NADH-quinone oxidoreductase subunit N
VAKLEIFSATAQAQEYGLLLVGVLAAVVTAFFYLRIAMTLLSKPEGEAAGSVVMRRVDALSAVVLVGAGVMVLLIGIAPDTFIHWARDASFLL